MKALLSKIAGGPELLTLDDIPDPSAGPGEIVIAVKAIGVNFPDLLIIADKYQFKPGRPFSPGTEVAGFVDSLGADVTGFAVGDRVMAMVGWGGMAEKVVARVGNCSRIPAAMDFADASAFLVTYGTSYYALRDRAGLKAGETLLILGAAGGVGLAAIELGKAMGARVVAAVSTAEKLAVAQAVGADAGIVYARGALDKTAQRALTDRFKEVCRGGPAVIVDTVGGDYAEAALRSIAWNGRFLVIGFPAGIPSIPLNLPLLKECDILGVFWGKAIELDPARHQQSVGELLELHLAGKIKPRIHRRYTLEEGAAALTALASRGVAGKLVVTVG